MNSEVLANNTINGEYPDLNKLKGTIDALIFDLDGTILDSMTLWNQVDVEFLSRYGFEVTKDYTDYVKRVSIDDAAIYTKERFNLKESPEEIKNAWNSMVHVKYQNEVKIFDGVFEYLTKASKLGFKIASATALTKENALAALKSNKIYDFFDCLITLEDLDSKTDKSKPDVYLKVASIIKAMPSRCLVFEDVEAAIKGAKLGDFKVTSVYDPIGSGSIESWERMVQMSDYAIKEW